MQLPAYSHFYAGELGCGRADHAQAPALAVVEPLLGTSSSGDLDDVRRLGNMAEFETSGKIAGWLVEACVKWL